jgi:hypothetical protein
MKRYLLISALNLICLSASADLVTDWNSIALDAIRAGKTPPPVAARNLAILHAAIFDACNGISRNYQPYFVTGKPAGVASKEAAITAAAREVLDSLFPAQRTNFEAACRNRLAELPGGRSKRAGISWGERVATGATTMVRTKSLVTSRGAGRESGFRRRPAFCPRCCRTGRSSPALP